MNSATSPKRTFIDNRAIWAIALPAMVTNVATALIGLGDMWIVGRLEDAATQGAVDVGARLFAVLFTVMNFLKTGTTGLVAQAGTREGEDKFKVWQIVPHSGTHELVGIRGEGRIDVAPDGTHTFELQYAWS